MACRLFDLVYCVWRAASNLGLPVYGCLVAPRRWLGAAAAGLALAFVSAGASAHGDTFEYSPVQSAARPFGLGIADRVALAGSDAASAAFLNNVLPTMQSLVGQNLGGIAVGSSLPSANGFVALDPNALRLASAVDMRVYFVGENTGYHDSLGFNTQGGGIDEGDPLLIFPDASIPPSYGNSKNAARSKNSPLFPGDFVELGTVDAGTKLDFFLIANGANNGKNVFSTDSASNPDGTTRAVAFAQANSPYVLIGFEDLIGDGQRDYSDVLFAVYVGENNLAGPLQPAPGAGVPASEPAFLWILVAACGSWLYRARRKQAAA